MPNEYFRRSAVPSVLQSLSSPVETSLLTEHLIVTFGAKDDPLLRNATNLSFVWFQAMLVLEFFVQLPLNVISLIVVLKSKSATSYSTMTDSLAVDQKKRFPIVLVYSTSCVVTTFICLVVILTTPGVNLMILTGYVPFFVLPLVMTIDFAGRLSSLIAISTPTQKKQL